jgi:hypothetical protein
MTLASGDLTTPQRVSNWLASPPALPSVILSQLITSMSTVICGKLNRARTFSQTFTRTFDGVGNMQIVLPDYPVTKIVSVQNGQASVPQSILASPGLPGSSPGYGYRCILWNGNLPGAPSVLEFAGGAFYVGAQNIKVTYVAGYLIQSELQTVSDPESGPPIAQVDMPLGVWCRDGGVTLLDGTPLTAVTIRVGNNEYIPPTDANPGLYTFSADLIGVPVLITYSFVPAALEEATIQMVAERYSYRSRVGDISKSLGGQETMRFFRGNTGRPWSNTSSLPPEVMDFIWDYVSVLPPVIGAPL